MADIATAEAARPIDCINRIVSAFLCVRHMRAEPCDSQHAPAICQKPVAVLLGPRVKDERIRQCCRLLDAFDLGTGLRRAGIILCRHDDGQCCLFFPADRLACEPAFDRRLEQINEIAVEPWHQHFAFGIAKTDIVFDQFRSGIRNHQSGEQNAFERRAALFHRLDGGQDDLIHDALFHRRRHHRRGRISAHAAGVRACIAIADALVILRRCERHGAVTIAQDEKRGFLAEHTFFDDDFFARLAKSARKHHADGVFRFGERHRHDDAFACRQPIRLDDDRRAFLPHISESGFGRGEAGISGGRDMGFVAQRFREGFRTFELRGFLRGAENADAVPAEIVGQTSDKRCFRADDDEADCVVDAKARHGLMVGDGKSDIGAALRCAGIAGCDE